MTNRLSEYERNDVSRARVEREVRTDDGDRVRTAKEYAARGTSPDGRDQYVEYVTTGSSRMSAGARIMALLTIPFLALETLLGARFLLRAFGANEGNGFVDWVMDWSYPFIRPFEGIFNNRIWSEGTWEWNTLIAMGVWLAAFILIGALIRALLPADRSGSYVRRERVTHA
jgi:hypothetical protein